MTSEPGIRFDYRPSSVPWRLAVVGLGLVLLALLAADIPWFWRLLMAIAATGLACHRQRHAKDRGVRRVHWASDGTWTLDLATGHEAAMELEAFRTFGSHVVLNLRTHDGPGPTLWLAGDNTHDATRRRLRVRLAQVHANPS